MQTKRSRRPYRVAQKQIKENPYTHYNKRKQHERFTIICSIILVFTFLNGFIIGHLSKN